MLVRRHSWAIEQLLVQNLDGSEVNICNHFAFTGLDSVGEAAARYWPDATTHIRWS